jgi:hypothetical protein
MLGGGGLDFLDFWAFLRGVLGETAFSWWCFCGENVVVRGEKMVMGVHFSRG